MKGWNMLRDGAKLFGKKTKYTLFAGLCFIYAGCSNQPKDDHIKSLITASLTPNHIPSTWVGYFASETKNASIKEIEIIERGELQETGKIKMFMVKARVKGECDVFTGLNMNFRDTNWEDAPIHKSFDRKLEFMIFTDDYGKWSAVLKEI